MKDDPSIRHFDNVMDARFHAVDVRFAAIDKATNVLSATVNRVPTDLQTAISAVESKMNALDGKFQVGIEALKDAAKERRQSDQEAMMKSDRVLVETKEGLGARINNLEIWRASYEGTAGGARGYRDDT